jgi:glutathione synthase/RimK-type ligase-like ATP-grasp enzyme
MVARSDVMLQQLVPEIRTSGEVSLMFFGGSFSHAVCKQPRDGEFRVQERLGGTIRATTPPDDLVEHARGLLETCAAGHLYARVDVVSTGDRFVLMEIELVEPSLYLEYVPAAARAFASAVRQIA